jgi:hypothetical protein
MAPDPTLHTTEKTHMPVTIHTHLDLSTSEMYDLTQTSDDIHDGDVFVCNGGRTIGFLMQAWPTLIAGELGSLEQATVDGMANFRREYPETFGVAERLALTLGEP